MRRLLLVLSLMLAGCGDGSACDDARCADAASPDAASDAGTPDAGTDDAGTDDAGPPDAGSPDAGSPDAGCVDTGAPSVTCPAAAVVDVGDAFAIDGVAFDECGVASTEWSVVSAPAGSSAAPADATAASTTITPDVAGELTLRFRATDGDGRNDSCDVSVTVVDPGVACGGGSGDHLLYRGVQPGLPQIEWGGREYAFALYGRIGGISESFVGRASATGAVTAAPALVSPADGSLSVWPRIARSDVGWGVTYLDDRASTSNRRAYFARLDASGALVAGSEVQVSDPSHTAGAVAIAWNPIDRRYGVAWSANDGGVHLRQFEADGTPVTSGATRVADGSIDYTGSPIVWASDRYAIVSTSPVRITEVRSDGTVAANVSLGAGGLRAAIAFSGAEYGVVWQQAGAVRFARATAAGLVSGSEVVLDPGPNAGEADLVWSGTEYGVTWDKGSTTVPSDVWFARVSAAGAVSGTRRLTTTSVVDWWPTITWCGQYAVVYEHGLAGVGEESEVHLVFP